MSVAGFLQDHSHLLMVCHGGDQLVAFAMIHSGKPQGSPCSYDFRGATRGDTPGIQGCGERAAGLLATATQGSDALLPVPLPHTRVLSQRRQSERPCSDNYT